ncbi:MAG TPA: polyprenyl synthetase family protein [Phycisphaerales bacterium]|nr:polyprenyl synthetase family protein [Phycisphaerales bacterium]
MRYAVLGGGKRIRPLLVWFSCQAFGGEPTRALPAAAAVEFVHAFSLVHDDLPAMDNDDLRRGRPTLHIHAGQAMAILAGDALLSLAYDTLARAGLDSNTEIALIRELATGCAGMISGQVFDTLPGVDPPIDSRAALERIHRNKTGALIRAACRMGAICAGANTEAMHAITAYADSIGLMFQAVDDLLDVEQPTDHTGKRTGKDADAGKLTFPGLLGVQGTREQVEALLGRAIDGISPLGAPAEPLVQLAEQLARRDR